MSRARRYSCSDWCAAAARRRSTAWVCSGTSLICTLVMAPLWRHERQTARATLDERHAGQCGGSTVSSARTVRVGRPPRRRRRADRPRSSARGPGGVAGRPSRRAPRPARRAAGRPGRRTTAARAVRTAAGTGGPAGLARSRRCPGRARTARRPGRRHPPGPRAAAGRRARRSGRPPAPAPALHPAELSDPAGTLPPAARRGGRRRTGRHAVIGDRQAADLDLVDLETALLRAAVGDYAAEAAVLLLVESGHWLPELQAAGLIAIALEDADGGPWAAVQWPDLDGALRRGAVTGSGGQLRLLRAAAGLADGQPVDPADLTAGVGRAQLTLLLAPLSHAAGRPRHPRGDRGAGGGHPG